MNVNDMEADMDIKKNFQGSSSTYVIRMIFKDDLCIFWLENTWLWLYVSNCIVSNHIILHAVSDYKKRSYKKQRWIFGKL